MSLSADYLMRYIPLILLLVDDVDGIASSYVQQNINIIQKK